LGRQVTGVTKEAMSRLCEYSWPGNARELENQIKRAMVVSREDILSDHHFEIDLTAPSALDESSGDRLVRATKAHLEEVLDAPEPASSVFEAVTGAVEKTLIEAALHKTHDNQAQAARLLGMNRSTLRKKRKDFGI